MGLSVTPATAAWSAQTGTSGSFPTTLAVGPGQTLLFLCAVGTTASTSLTTSYTMPSLTALSISGVVNSDGGSAAGGVTAKFFYNDTANSYAAGALTLSATLSASSTMVGGFLLLDDFDFDRTVGSGVNVGQKSIISAGVTANAGGTASLNNAPDVESTIVSFIGGYFATAPSGLTVPTGYTQPTGYGAHSSGIVTSADAVSAGPNPTRAAAWTYTSQMTAAAAGVLSVELFMRRHRPVPVLASPAVIRSAVM